MRCFLIGFVLQQTTATFSPEPGAFLAAFDASAMIAAGRLRALALGLREQASTVARLRRGATRMTRMSCEGQYPDHRAQGGTETSSFEVRFSDGRPSRYFCWDGFGR